MTDALHDLSEQFRHHTDSDAREFAASRERDEAILLALNSLKQSNDELQKTLQPISQAYNGFLFSKSFVTGLSSFILGLAAIGAVLIGFFDLFKQQ